MTALFDALEKDSDAAGDKNDCAVKAVAIVTGYEEDYDGVHYAFELHGRRHRKTTPFFITEKVVKSLKHEMVDVTDHFDSRTVRTLEREMGCCHGNYLVRVRGHILAVQGGQVHDWTKGRCHRIVSIHRITERN